APRAPCHAAESRGGGLIGDSVATRPNTVSEQQQVPKSTRDCSEASLVMLTPSTPFAVSAGRFTWFRVVSYGQISRFRRSRLFVVGSTPGSSTKKSQVSDPFPGSLASHQHAINCFAPG